MNSSQRAAEETRVFNTACECLGNFFSKPIQPSVERLEEIMEIIRKHQAPLIEAAEHALKAMRNSNCCSMAESRLREAVAEAKG